MRKLISNGENIPPFYGVAYYKWEDDKCVCYPIPINLFVILYRDFVYWFKNPKGRKR